MVGYPSDSLASCFCYYTRTNVLDCSSVNILTTRLTRHSTMFEGLGVEEQGIEGTEWGSRWGGWEVGESDGVEVDIDRERGDGGGMEWEGNRDQYDVIRWMEAVLSVNSCDILRMNVRLCIALWLTGLWSPTPSHCSTLCDRTSSFYGFVVSRVLSAETFNHVTDGRFIL